LDVNVAHDFLNEEKLNPTSASNVRTDNEPSLLLDFEVTNPNGARKLLFKKNDNNSFGLLLKKFFLRPIMRMLAKQHIVSLFETSLSGFQEAKDFIATARQNNSWGQGVKASEVKKIISRASLRGYELKNPQDRGWSDTTINNIVTEYLNDPGNLADELRRLLAEENLPETGLQALMQYAANPKTILSVRDNAPILALMRHIARVEDRHKSTLPTAFNEKISAVFENYDARYEAAKAEGNFVEIKNVTGLS
jgi:hypothetical protein